MSETSTALQLLKQAQNNRALWNDFPGMETHLTLKLGDDVVEGLLSVTAEGEVTVDLPDIPQKEEIEGRLQSLIMHRLPSSQDEPDVIFADDVTTHPYGRLIAFQNDRFGSSYRIQDDIIREVHRSMGPMKFTITVVDVYRNSEQKVLPHTYIVDFWDTESSRHTSSTLSHYRWEKFGSYDVPSSVVTVTISENGTRMVEEILFHDYRLQS